MQTPMGVSTSKSTPSRSSLMLSEWYVEERHGSGKGGKRASKAGQATILVSRWPYLFFSTTSLIEGEGGDRA